MAQRDPKGACDIIQRGIPPVERAGLDSTP